MAVAKPRQSTTAAPTAAPANQAIHLADYSPHPRNYNRHSTEQIQKIAASLTAFGQVRSIVVWRKWFLAGHGVALAAASLGWTERAPPERAAGFLRGKSRPQLSGRR